MKIAIAVEGTRGDVYPMLAMGRAFSAAGHSVRMVAPPDFLDVIEDAGMEAVSLGMPIREYLTETAAALHSKGPAFILQMGRWGKESIHNQFALLPDVVSGMDRVFAAGTILGAASAAELHGIPFRYVAYTPGIIPSDDHTPVLLPFQVESRRINRLLWKLSGGFLNLLARRLINQERMGLGLEPIKDVLTHALQERLIVAVDRPLAPMPENCGAAYDQIRCLHPMDPEPLPAKLEDFLNQGEPPIYLGFGSMPDPNPGQTTREILDAVVDLGCRAIISRGWAQLGEGALPEGVMAIDPVSHAVLFPRMAVVVHHGGAGTTHSAARAGVPQLIMPHVLDQFYFARRVAALGVGPPAIPRNRLTATRLAETLRATLDNELLAERAAELGQALVEMGPIAPDVERLLALP